MKQGILKIAVLVALTLLISTSLAWAVPQLTLNSVSVSKGQSCILTLSLTGGTAAYAGVNAAFDLPAGVSLVSVEPGALTTGNFSVASHKSLVNGKERVAVIAYSGVSTFPAQSGILLNVTVQATANASSGAVPFVTSGLSNADGSVSVSHTLSNGAIAIVIGNPTLPNPIVSGTTPTTDTTPTWTWISGGGSGNGTYRYKLDNSDLTTGATQTTALSFTPTNPLSTANHTLYVQERDNAGNWSASGSFTISIVPAYTISFSFTGSGAMTCTPATVPLGGSFTCTISPAGGYYLESLLDNTVDVTSSVSGNGYTVDNVSADHNVVATFRQNPAVLRIWGDTEPYFHAGYSSIQEAYLAALNNDDILIQALPFEGDLNFYRDVFIWLQGGYDSDFEFFTGFTTVHGKMKISNGTVIIENLKVK